MYKRCDGEDRVPSQRVIVIAFHVLMNHEQVSTASAMPCCFIPPESPFLPTLARWVLTRFGQDPAALSRVLILLPNRRSCRALREAFLESSRGVPLLLPRLQPLGELDDASALFMAEAAEIPPAIPSLRRELLLTRMIMAFRPRSGQGGGYSLEQAARLAGQLGQFLDDVAREDIRLDRLERLVPEELASHWQQTLEFLNIISRHWPALLEEEGAIDAVDHRTRMLKATAAAWAKHPPGHPVIAAGSTGSQPATAQLLDVIARMPGGHVILPGLDTRMPESEWDMLTETHPQYALKHLLSRLAVRREAVLPLAADRCVTSQQRTDVLRAVFQPPAATAGWALSVLPLREGLAGVRLLTAPTQHDEARMIAIALRETLETPAKTAALVTPDRTLARMVAAQMHRLGVTIDDSAGRPLSHTPAGCFLRLAIAMTASAAAPAALLALLRHPLAALGMDPAQCRLASRQMEVPLLRGLRRDPGLPALAQAAAKRNIPSAGLLQYMAELEKPLREMFEANEMVPLRALLEAHIAFAQEMARTREEEGASRLWSRDCGEQLAAFIAELLDNAALLPQVEPHAYPALLELLLHAQTFRPRYGSHPRLHILSPIEARLQRFDRVILAGLNEGTWPAADAADPWMSRPMREDFGLPSSDRGVGQSAHDFAMLAAAPEVILSRAEKIGGTPAIPSRWLVRLKTLVQGLDRPRYEGLACEAHYAQGIALLHRPEAMPELAPPSCVPPASARPRQLPVTAVDMWVRNPYHLYARYILKLRPLDALDQEPDASDYGILIHAAMELLTRRYPSGRIPAVEEELMACGRESFAPMMDRPAVACLWWPRFLAMVPWLAQQEQERRAGGITVYGELEGVWPVTVDGQDFTLTARIDRMEVKNGIATITDYKTGTLPSATMIKEGAANQLPLQALIATEGRFRGGEANPVTVSALEYWRLGGHARKCDIMSMDTALIAPARARLEGLIADYAKDETAYAAPLDPADERYDDYGHFTRRQEWDPV